MCAAASTGNDLQWEVLTIKRPGLTRDLPPGKEDLMWVANSSTLICGKYDAILVDTFLTTEHEVTEITPSRTNPDRGIVVLRNETRNQRGEVVLVLTAKLVVPRKPQASAPPSNWR